MGEKKSVPPFIENISSGSEGKTVRTMKMMVMLLGSGVLFVAMIGSGKLLWEILNEGLASNIDTLGAKMLWIGILFLVGWITSLVSIRVLNNLVMPLIINYFMGFTLFGILLLYARVIQELYMESFFADQYLRYSLVFAAGFVALIGLHLLIEDHDLRPFSLPILVMTIIHLFVAVLHYVFQDGNPDFAIGDLIYFVSMLFIVILMVLHLGILNPFRRSVDRLFERAEENLQS